MGAPKKDSVLPGSMTVDEFIDWPGDGIHKKFQLIDGEILAMSPASTTHGAVQANLAILIGNCLRAKKSPCAVMTEPAVETHINADGNLRVPDLGVTCAKTEPGQIALPEPILLIEILSPGNKKATRDNVWAYTTIPSVAEILVVQSTRIEADLLRRGADRDWPKKAERIGPDGRVILESIGLDCALTELYEKTHLAKA